MLHEAYRSLAAQGFCCGASDQDDATTLHRLRTGYPFVALMNGALVGTITLYGPSADSICEWYKRAGVYRFGQFGVRPDVQQHGIGFQLYGHAEGVARSLGAAELALDTAEGATQLREWYARLGFRIVDYASWPQTSFRSVILSKALGGRPA